MSIEQFSKEAWDETNTLFPTGTLKTVFDCMQKTNFYNELIMGYWRQHPEELALRKAQR